MTISGLLCLQCTLHHGAHHLRTFARLSWLALEPLVFRIHAFAPSQHSICGLCIRQASLRIPLFHGVHGESLVCMESLVAGQ